jgi:hypothetical protein
MLSESMGFGPKLETTNASFTVDNHRSHHHTSVQSSLLEGAVMGQRGPRAEGEETGPSRALLNASEQTGLEVELNSTGSQRLAQQQQQQQQQDFVSVLRRLLAILPGTPQALSSSPLLDPCMFNYDRKLVGPLIR